MQETCIQSLGQEDALEKEMAIHPSILTWEIPRIEEPGGLQSMGSQKSQTWLSHYTTNKSILRVLLSSSRASQPVSKRRQTGYRCGSLGHWWTSKQAAQGPVGCRTSSVSCGSLGSRASSGAFVFLSSLCIHHCLWQRGTHQDAEREHGPGAKEAQPQGMAG